MTRTPVSRLASNWVDRGEPPNPTLRRVLAHYFQRLDPAFEPWLEEQAQTIMGMVAADATEVHVAGYLRHVVRELGGAVPDPVRARTTAIAVWHVVKAALVRDFAGLAASGELSLELPTPESLSHWLAARLLTPEELARFEREGS